MIKITHNLNDVIDYVESLKNEIESLNAQAVDKARSKLYSELPNVFGDAISYLNIDIQSTSSGSVTIIIDSVDFDDVYNTYGKTEDDILEFIEDFLLNEIGNEFKEANFEWQ
jgi:CII-binding regulator of phage lambda lysogenization HflD